MPRLLSPSEALERTQHTSGDKTQQLGSRVSIKIWRKIAQWALDKGYDDMSTAFRTILEEWAADQPLGPQDTINQFSTARLAEALSQRGLLVLHAEDIAPLVKNALDGIRREVAEAVETTLSRSTIEGTTSNVVERIRQVARWQTGDGK